MRASAFYAGLFFEDIIVHLRTSDVIDLGNILLSILTCFTFKYIFIKILVFLSHVTVKMKHTLRFLFFRRNDTSQVSYELSLMSMFTRNLGYKVVMQTRYRYQYFVTELCDRQEKQKSHLFNNIYTSGKNIPGKLNILEYDRKAWHQKHLARFIANKILSNNKQF